LADYCKFQIRESQTAISGVWVQGSAGKQVPTGRAPRSQLSGVYIAPYLPEAALQIAGSAASFAVIALLFAMMFKWLPDAQVAWRDVWLGAILTAAFFEVGKFLIGLYIGKQGLESTYGAAASIVVVLIWVYYSAQLVLMGAEFTNVYARRYGSHRHAPSGDARSEVKTRNIGRARAA
jgi:membrane protein